jgi:acyl carrier protein
MTRDQIAAELRKILVEKFDAEAAMLGEDASFIDDLGHDSLDHVEFVMEIEDRFEIELSDEESENVLTIGGAIDALVRKLAVPA